MRWNKCPLKLERDRWLKRKDTKMDCPDWSPAKVICVPKGFCGVRPGVSHYYYKRFDCPENGTYTAQICCPGSGGHGIDFEVQVNGKTVIHRNALLYGQQYVVKFKLQKGYYVFGVKITIHSDEYKGWFYNTAFEMLLKDDVGRPVLWTDDTWLRLTKPLDWYKLLPKQIQPLVKQQPKPTPTPTSQPITSQSSLGSKTMLTRAQGALLFWKFLGSPYYKPSTPYFDDVSPTSQLYIPAEALHHLGIVNGVASHHFGVNLPFTRAQAVTMIVRALHFPLSTTNTPYFKDVPPTYWAFKYVQTAKEHGIIKGNNLFRPEDGIKPSELSDMFGQARKSVLMPTPASMFTSIPSQTGQPTQAGIIPVGTSDFLHKYELPIVLGLGLLLTIKLLRD